MDNRFVYVVATDMKSLVDELNKLQVKYMKGDGDPFNVVYMSNGVAVIDRFPQMVVGVELEEDEFAEIQMNAVPPSPSFA